MVNNTFAEIVAGWLTAAFRTAPTFRRRRRGDGELEAFVTAPRGSTAGHLTVLTDKGNLWLRFDPPRMFYGLDGRTEMLSIVRGLLSERTLFVTVYRGNEWRGTTLARRGAQPRLRRGETAYIVSWSGRYDRVVAGTSAELAVPEEPAVPTRVKPRL
jgi:hypothetical protein